MNNKSTDFCAFDFQADCARLKRSRPNEFAGVLQLVSPAPTCASAYSEVPISILPTPAVDPSGNLWPVECRAEAYVHGRLPKTTEAERLIVQRVGQTLFRDGLLDLWEGRCAVTGLAVPALLRASHIKPWSDCETNAERLDVYNGILLAPHLDAAFDRGFITVQDDGTIIVSDALDTDARTVLGLAQPLRVRGLADGHRSYLPWHRQRVFEKEQDGGQS